MPAHSDGETPAHECPACQVTVPVAPFCGNCGDAAGTRRYPLRPATFAVAPEERVEWPMVTSSMFPHLAERYRIPFRHGLFLLLAMLVAFSMLRLLGPLVIVVSFGVPLLFGLYIWRSDGFRDISAPALGIATVLGAGLGAGWWLWSGSVVADAYGIPLGAASQLGHALSISLTVTLVGAALMLLPAPAVRMLRAPARESLDGFRIGALGALSYSAAGTTAWLAPQLAAGLLENYSPWRLLEEAILYGLVDPLNSVAAGGSVGLALWFRPARRESRQPQRVRGLLWVLAAVCTGLYMGTYVVDAAELNRAAEIAINTVITAVSMVVVRVGVQAALLNETPDPATGLLVHCDHCGQSVPDMSFCPNCGAATKALSRSARRLRRLSSPDPAAAPVEGGE